MTRLRVNRTAALAFGLSGLTAGLVALAPALLDADSLLTKGVSTAFSARPVPAATTATLPFDPQGLRLSAWREGDGMIAGPVHIGDRITISGTDGRQRILEVVESRILDGARGAGEEARLVLVTTRAVGEPDRILRFVVESPVETRTVAPGPHRAL